MSLKGRIDKLEDAARKLPDSNSLVDIVLDYKDGQPPITVKAPRQSLADIERFYGLEAEAERAQRRGDRPSI
jgi:hypothetical protein